MLLDYTWTYENYGMRDRHTDLTSAQPSQTVFRSITLPYVYTHTRVSTSCEFWSRIFTRDQGLPN